VVCALADARAFERNGRNIMPKYPLIREKPGQTMAVVTAVGDPNEKFADIMPALYGSVYTVKFDLKKRTGDTFKVDKLRARYPDAHLKPKDQWTIVAGVPIPDSIETLPQKIPDVEVRVEKWEYGTVAEIVHKGPFSEEGPTIKSLHEFIEQQGYEIAGAHEEEYLTSPDAKEQKTLIRYPVRKK
jgi:hypothetical protein